MMWFVVASMGGLRVEQHQNEPDNMLWGPYQSGDEAVAKMMREASRDRKELLAAWTLTWLAGVLVCGWLGWVIIGWVMG